MEAFNAFNRTRFDRAGFRFGSGAFGQVGGLAERLSPPPNADCRAIRILIWANG